MELPPDFPQDKIPPGLLDNPPTFDALKQQLGLRLDPQKSPVEYLAVDHVERPSDN